jgi:hypothetical protein
MGREILSRRNLIKIQINLIYFTTIEYEFKPPPRKGGRRTGRDSLPSHQPLGFDPAVEEQVSSLRPRRAAATSSVTGCAPVTRISPVAFSSGPIVFKAPALKL